MLRERMSTSTANHRTAAARKIKQGVRKARKRHVPDPSRKRSKRGYPALLNTDAQPHWTVVLSDFSLSAGDFQRLEKQLAAAKTRPIFMSFDGRLDTVTRRMRSAGVNLQNDYVS